MKNVLLLALYCSLIAPAAFAGPGDEHGHDHGDASVAASADAPRRLPDGAVFLPKRAQRQLGVRHVVTAEETLPITHQWVGTVIMDPSAGGKVQATVAGRVEAGPNGLPRLGQTVRKGEVLAYVRPSTDALARASQAAQAAELRAERDLAEKRLARLEQLQGSVPQKEIDAARAELGSLKERVTAIGGSLVNTEALKAPVSGVIASSNVVAGQVIDAREVVYEIVDPDRLIVEAITHDPALANDVARASASVDGGRTSFALQWVGAGRALREQALPVWFETADKNVPPLSVGQKLQVVVQTQARLEGIAIPAAAVRKDPSNRDIVWVHTSAERFEPHPVRYRPLDGSRVAVTNGLHAGDRVVVQGAALINQIR